MSNILIAKAVAALETSVASIIGCDEDDATKRSALAESFSQFEDYMKHNGVGSDIVAKADRSGPQNLSAALLNHLHDALGRKRQRHGFEKTEKALSMDKTETLRGIAKAGGIITVAKAIVDENRNFGIGEAEFVSLVTEHAKAQHPNLTDAQAFAKMYEIPEIWRACNVLKSMPFQVSLEPLQVGGEDTRDLSDESKAVEQLKQLGRDRWPTASAADQFERALTAPENHALARRAVPIPRATTSFPFPH
jgi:hypothetical protein